MEGKNRDVYANRARSVSLNSKEQMEAALRELVRRQGKRGWCRGEPITDAGKRKQLAKMLFLTLVPILILMGLSVYFMSESVRSRIESAKLRNKIAFSIEVGRFIYSFQRERDMSVLYLSDIGPGTKTFLLARYPDTDEALEDLSDWPADVDWLNRPEFETKQAFLRQLNQHRNELDLLNYTIYEEIKFYSDATHVFVRWLYDSIKESKYGTIWKTLVAYQKVIAGLEDVGVERALGAAYFSLGQFDSHAHYELYNKKVHVFKANIRAAKRFSPLVAPIADYRVQTTAKNISNNIDYFRDEIRENYFYKRKLVSSSKKGTRWYDNMTLYIDIILKVQQDLAKDIDLLLSDKANNETTTVTISAIIIIIVFSMCPIIIRTVQQLTNDIQSFALTLAEKTKELNREKNKMENLLYHRVPKAIADDLKIGKEVNAEYYKEVTICFMSMVEFNKIATEGAPTQIITLVNYLATVIDRNTSHFDVYKVDCIGDSQMLASGLPNRNGYRHATEITNMCIDLIGSSDAAITETIGGMEEFKVRLRIGIHSGPCIAGIVGKKLPRYYLFGETVTIASKMESSGEPNKIHVSVTTYRHLMKCGGYVLKQRSSPEVKVYMHKNKINTYWLQGRESSPKSSLTNVKGRHRTISIDSADDPLLQHSRALNKASVPPAQKERVTIENETGQAQSSRQNGNGTNGAAMPSVVVKSVPRTSFKDVISASANAAAQASDPANACPSLETVADIFQNKKGSPPIMQLTEGVHY